MTDRAKLVSVNNITQKIRETGHDVLKVLNQYLQGLNDNPNFGRMFSEIKLSENGLNFEFAGIPFKIEILHNTESGYIRWSYHNKSTQEIIWKPIVLHRFDNLGNIFDGNVSLPIITSEYYKELIPTLVRIIDKVLNDKDLIVMKFKELIEV